MSPYRTFPVAIVVQEKPWLSRLKRRVRRRVSVWWLCLGRDPLPVRALRQRLRNDQADRMTRDWMLP